MKSGLSFLLPVSVALGLFLFVYVALQLACSICPHAAPAQTNAASHTSWPNSNNNDNQVPGAGLLKQLFPKSPLLGLEKGIETLDENGIPVVLVGSESAPEDIFMEEDGNGLVGSAVRKLERQKLFPCKDISSVPFLGQRGHFRVLYNYITPTVQFACDEAVTYTMHTDFTNLDNLVPLLERWLGPVSVSLYTPGTDYYETLLRIHYLRKCSPLVSDFVSFHLFFDNNYIPPNLSKTAETAFANMPAVNCSVRPNFGPNVETFRKSRKPTYLLNVGRNVAREMASTYYVLASDIELYPSANLIGNFLEMIEREGSKFLESPNPKVFVLPVFEVDETVSVLPCDKMELQKLLAKFIAIPLRKKLSPKFFTFPKEKEWMRARMTEGLHVFAVGKRQGPQYHWEPIYIGTKFDPIYDERLTWMGYEDKIIQGYILCVLDYEFHILDNAFLLHRPRIKKGGNDPESTQVRMQRRMIKTIIEPELKSLYGGRTGCSI